MKTAKKLVVLMVVLAMVFALSTTAFAASVANGTVDVTLLVPKSYVHPQTGITVNIPKPDVNYISSTAHPGYWEYTETEIPLSTVSHFNNHTGSTTVFDVLFEVITDTNYKGESFAEEGYETTSTQFVYGYDSNPWSGNPGWYITRLSGLETDEIASYYSETIGNSYWAGLSWAMYCNSTLLNGYASNVTAAAGNTYSMIYEYSYQIW